VPASASSIGAPARGGEKAATNLAAPTRSKKKRRRKGRGGSGSSGNTFNNMCETIYGNERAYTAYDEIARQIGESSISKVSEYFEACLGFTPSDYDYDG